MLFKMLRTAATTLLLSTTLASPSYRRQYGQDMIYDFKDLKPSTDLNWTPCFDQFTCTVLQVPLDYKDTAAGTTNIAYIKWSSNSTSTDSSSKPQDILINPGGPGGSGVAIVLQLLSYLQQALGTQNNIVGFDPRGVNNSGPDLSCFPGKHHTQLYYDKDLREPTDVNDPKALADTWARAGAFGDWCSKVHSGGNSSAKYVSTVATASDMLHYTELLAKSKDEDPTKSQLWYYGTSYGTVLGSTFSSLFPDRVGRVILDGVDDAEDYYQGKWLANLPDADAAVETFFKYCSDAGSEKCAFWADSPKAVKARYEKVVKSLKARPLIVTDEKYVQYPTIITYSDFEVLLGQAPYEPVVYFPLLASILAEMEAGNAGSLAQFTVKGLQRDSCSASVDRFADLEPSFFISCIDADNRYNLTDYDKWVEHANTLVEQSHYLGPSWATSTAVMCRSLHLSAPDSQKFKGPPSAKNTSNPILFTSATIDPVTPLRAAKKMTKLFGGARLLIQESVGHTTESAKSNCTMGYMRQYIKDASLPPEGTVCKADKIPFESDSSSGLALGATSQHRKRESMEDKREELIERVRRRYLL